MDGDGYSDLVVRYADGRVVVYWGSPKGIETAYSTPVSVVLEPEGSDGVSAADRATAEYIQDAKPLRLEDLTHIVVAGSQRAELVPVNFDRSFGLSTVFNCEQALAVAQGNINGCAMVDLVFTCRQPPR